MEVTWRGSPGASYLGVVFSVERADNATWIGDASVLDDFNRRWPLLREPWQGENDELVWETSELLAAMRTGDRALLQSLVEREAMA